MQYAIAHDKLTWFVFGWFDKDIDTRNCVEVRPEEKLGGSSGAGSSF